MALLRDAGQRAAAVGRADAREAEVHDLDDAVGPDHDVLRLEVAVDDPGTVRRLERGRALPHQVERLRQLGRTFAQPLRSDTPSTNSVAMNHVPSTWPTS